MRSIGLLSEAPSLPGVRVRELLVPLGFDGGKTIADDHLREVRPSFCGRGRISGLCIGRGRSARDCGKRVGRRPSVTARTARACVVVCCVAYSRAGAGALIFSKEAPDVLWGMALRGVGVLEHVLQRANGVTGTAAVVARE
jgi:hypothetical protein